jgi:hypothetical protein
VTYLEPGPDYVTGRIPTYKHGTGPFTANREMKRAAWFSYPRKVREDFKRRMIALAAVMPEGDG